HCMLLAPPTTTLFPYTTLFRSRQRPASSRATVWMLPTSLPACGSVIATAPFTSPRTTRGTQRRFCSSLPKRRIIAAGSLYPMPRSEEHTSELQSRGHLVCRLLL